MKGNRIGMMRCEVCGYTTKFQSYMARHMLRHGELRAFACNECGSKFKTRSAYNLHLREMHGPTAHQCRICGLEFTHKRALDRHMLCHSDDKPIVCDHCGYACKRKHDLVCHARAMHDSNDMPRKRHDARVASFFSSLDLTFTREYTVKVPTFGGRKFARADFHIPMVWGDVLFECDELQHCMHSVRDECQRMAAICDYHRQRHPNRRLHIIRYNPNAYKQGGIVVKPTADEQTASIAACLAYVPESDIEITYLFYRTAGGMPAITTDPQYTLRSYVRIA